MPFVIIRLVGEVIATDPVGKKAQINQAVTGPMLRKKRGGHLALPVPEFPPGTQYSIPAAAPLNFTLASLERDDRSTKFPNS